MPSNLSKGRQHKAFNEGRRSATVEHAQNPYDNAKLRALWEKGRAMQRAGELKAPVPQMEHGETRAQRAPQNPPGTKPVVRRPSGPGPRRNFGGGRGLRGP